jgi:hypothetical protein
MVSLELAGRPWRASWRPADDATPTEDAAPAPAANPFGVIWILLLWQTAAVVFQVLAMYLARHGVTGAAPVMSAFAIGMTFASALRVLMAEQLSRAARNAAVLCLGVVTTVQWRVSDPLLLTGLDEQLHLRTLQDIVLSHSLFQPHPQLAVSPRYPGLETLTALLNQLGLPLMVAVVGVILAARVALVLTLCDAVEHLTGSPRAGGLAVAAYGMSAQFIFFNSQFAYQTLALPLALAAVAFVARARRAQHPGALFVGAAVCLLAVAMTHHVTSFLTAAFLAVWAVAQRGSPDKRRVFYGALIATTTTTMWAVVQWSLLQAYLGPIADDMTTQLTGGFHRTPFHDEAGEVEPMWERLLMLYYAVALTAVVSTLMLISARSILRRRRSRAGSEPAGDAGDTNGPETVQAVPRWRPAADPEPARDVEEVRSGWNARIPVGVAAYFSSLKRSPQGDSQQWEPSLLLVLMATSIPVLFAARIMPSWGALGDRFLTFLFLPLSVLVAEGAVRWSRGLSPSNEAQRNQLKLLRSVAIVLATGVFVGGHLMGSGPDWARLPGRYLVSADGRSMDSETLAAVRWAVDGLPVGSRIAADRVSSVLLSAQARAWPVMRSENDLIAPEIYFADSWGPHESKVVRHLHLRYLYVDRRFANELPHLGTYFYKGETQGPQRLTRAELTKFDNVDGLRAVYRHGPIVIYDTSGLGVRRMPAIWYREARPMTIPGQLLIGLLAGLAIVAAARTRARRFVIDKARTLHRAAGPSLTYAVGLGAVCLTSVMMLMGRIWLGPMVFLSAAAVVLLVNRRWFTALLRNAAAKLRWKWFVACVAIAVPFGAAIAESIVDAYPSDVTNVQSILDDPSAVHVSAHKPKATSEEHTVNGQMHGNP